MKSDLIILLSGAIFLFSTSCNQKDSSNEIRNKYDITLDLKDNTENYDAENGISTSNNITKEKEVFSSIDEKTFEKVDKKLNKLTEEYNLSAEQHNQAYKLVLDYETQKAENKLLYEDNKELKKEKDTILKEGFNASLSKILNDEQLAIFTSKNDKKEKD